MCAWLDAIKRTIQIKILLGICPFQLDVRNGRVDPRSTITIYTIIYILVNVIVYPILTVEFIKHIDMFDMSHTTIFASYVENTFVYTLHAAMLMEGLRTRQQHARLLNSLARICDRFRARHPLQWHRHLLRMLLQKWFFAMLQFVSPCLYIYYRYAGTLNAIIQMYSIVYCVAATSMLLMVLHVQELMICVADCLADGWRGQSMDMQTMWFGLEVWLKFSHCFGVQLLLNSIKDSFVMATTLFCLYVEVFINEIGLETLCFYVSVFMIPTILKNVMFVRAIDRIEYQVYRFRKVLVGSLSNTEASF